MRHKLCRSFHPWCPGVKTRCLLSHWGRVTHICVSDLTSIGSDNGLSPGLRQAIIRTNAGILLIRPLGTNVSEFLVEITSFKKMRLKVSSAKRRPFCLGLNELYSYRPGNILIVFSKTLDTVYVRSYDELELTEFINSKCTCSISHNTLFRI